MKRMVFNAAALTVLALSAAMSADAATPMAGIKPVGHTIIVTRGKPATIAAEKLRIELVKVEDGRCQIDMRCVWAGHAAVTLSVSRAGGKRRKVVIGTPVPAGMDLPTDAVDAGYRYELVSLQPENNGKPVQYLATVRVTKK